MDNSTSKPSREYRIWTKKRYPQGTSAYAGNLPPLIAHDKKDPEFNRMLIVICLATGILSTQECKTAMAHLALNVDRSQNHSRRFSGHFAAAIGAVDGFVTEVANGFPIIVIDEDPFMENIDILGYTQVRTWAYPLTVKDQMVYLNALRYNDFLKAGANQKSSGTRYTRFVFMFALTLVHEIGGHLFVNFLWQGNRPLTPPDILHPYYEGDQSGGESGRWLELAVLGGGLEFYRDPNEDDGQAGIPYLIGEDLYARPVLDISIAEITTQIYSFPLKVAEPGVDPKTMRSMGRQSSMTATTIDKDVRQMVAQALRERPGTRVLLEDVSQLMHNQTVQIRAT